MKIWSMDNLSDFVIRGVVVLLGAQDKYLSSFMENLKLHLSSIGKFEAAVDISLPNRYLNVA